MLDCDNYDGCHLYPPHIYPFMYFNCTVTWLFIYSKMFNSINKYFTRLTPNQIELRELLDRQASRAALQAREARETVVQETTSEVINLIDNDEEIAVTNSLQDAFQRIIDSGELPTVVSSTVEITEPLKRHKNKRPCNWTDIADHFITYGKYLSTQRLTYQRSSLNGLKPAQI